MNSINLNKRVECALWKLPDVQNHLGRLAVISIPFLSLYKPAQTGVAFLSSSVQLIDLFQSDKGQSEKMVKSAQIGAVLFLTLFRPKEAALFALASQTYEDIKEKNAYAIFSRIIYLVSLHNRDPRWVVLALALEIAKEAKEAKDEFFKGRWLEAGAKLVMAALRSYQAEEEVSRVRRRFFGKEVTQAVWDEIIKEKDLAKALKDKNFSDTVKNIKVKPLQKKAFDEVTLKNMVFEKVDFSESSLRYSCIEDVTFKECKMEDIYLHKVSMVRVIWERCNVSKGTFYHCKGVGLQFKWCDLTRFCLSECEIDGLEIFASKLYGASFFNNVLRDSALKSCDLANVLLTNAMFTLIDCTKNLITKPVIALTWDFSSGGSWGEPIPDVLDDQGMLTLKFPICPKDIGLEALKHEVHAKLKTYPVNGPKSRPQMLLDDPRKTPEIEKMKVKAQEVMKYAIGAILSGGDDVEKSFYSQSDDGFDFRRSIMEFAVLHRGKPVMGICRGSQLLNVYFGGTIKDVDLQSGKQELHYQEGSRGEILRKKVGSTIMGYSAHSQAVDRLGKGLHVLLERDGVVKATIHENGRVLGTQFHPEKYIEQKRIENQLRKIDMFQLISILSYYFNNLNLNRLEVVSGEPAVNADMTLTKVGEREIVKLCNLIISRMKTEWSDFQNNQVFFKIFREMVSRGGSTPPRLESARGG